jgi:hypothetical protein
MLQFGVRAGTFLAVRAAFRLLCLKPLVPDGRRGGFGGRRIAFPDLHWIQTCTPPALTAMWPAPVAEAPVPGSTMGCAVIRSRRSLQD